MSTAIEWTEETWNPTVGCDRISPGCAKCYAKTLHDKRHKAALEGKKMAPQYAKPFETLQLIGARLDAPLRWKRPRKVFVNSVSDLFHEDVPDAFIDHVFAVMAQAPQHTFQMLTKRAVRMRDYMERPDRAVARLFLVADAIASSGTKYAEAAAWSVRHGLTLGVEPGKPRWPLPNVWLGVSVENQHFADERIPSLLQTPAAVRFISAEPLLGPVDVRPYMPNALWNDLPSWKEPELDWVIVGGESGAGARPFRVQWARAILAQCRAAGVACFMKQLGSNLIDDDIPGPQVNPETGARTLTVRQTLTIRDRKGGDPAEWPEDLRVREFPAVRA